MGTGDGSGQPTAGSLPPVPYVAVNLPLAVSRLDGASLPPVAYVAVSRSSAVSLPLHVRSSAVSLPLYVHSGLPTATWPQTFLFDVDILTFFNLSR